MKKTNQSMTSVSRQLSKEEKLYRDQLKAYNESPEDEKLIEEVLEGLKQGQREEAEMRKEYGLK